MEKKNVRMQIINPHCAGIDIGSRSHYVAVGQELSDVKEFGVYADDLVAICEHLKANGITSVAMESTGSYWQNLYVELVRYDFEVVLANGKFTKNIKGKKTDVKDARWIQKLHSIGLLSGSFLPDEQTEKLRTFCRQRENWITLAAEATHKMQKYLKLLNFRLDVVVRDVTGLTGLTIIKDICNGNLDPASLAKHRHFNCRKSEEEIAKALKGNNREDYLFGLKQELECYHFYQKKIVDCEKMITAFLKNQINTQPEKKKLKTTDKQHKRINKNAIKGIDLNQASFQYFGGIDLMAIEGLGHSTILSIISEVGPEGFKKFETAKQFTSWLRLAPNNKISGGKLLSSKTPKGSNRLKIALRNAANAVGNLKDTHLSNFFNRVCYRKGRTVAVSAIARKLVVIIWNMIVKNIPYQPPSQYLFLDEKRKLKLVSRIRKTIDKFEIKANDLGFELH
ncbi:MAG: IS110 family transposase [Bacteroidetes bacterium]|nr:IS110 family transposase [Bacteroidota bacterium]